MEKQPNRRGSKMKEEICLLCGNKKGITNHHLTIKPMRKNRKTPKIIPLCRNCHDAVESAKVYISKANRLRKSYNKGYEKGFEEGKKSGELK